jgi:hypothetical protein
MKMRKRNTFHAVVGLLGLVATAFFFGAAYGQVDPDSSQLHFTKQTGTILNSSDTSAADTAIVKTLTGVATEQVHLYGVDVICSTGTSSVTVDDGATEIFSLAVGTTQDRIRWEVPLTGTPGSDLVVTLATCGGSNTGTLIIQADQY